MSSRRHKLHKSIKNKSRRLGKRGGGFYAMLGRSAIRTGSSFGTLGAKIVVPIILRTLEPPLKPEQRKTAVKYFKQFANSANGFIQHNVTAAGTKKLMDTIMHPEVVAASIAKKVSDKADAMKAKYSDPAEREKLLARAKAKASSAAESAKSVANQVTQTEQFKNVSKVVSESKKKITDSNQFKVASAAANSAVKSEEFKALSAQASSAASNATVVASKAFNNATAKPVALPQNSKGGSKKSMKKTKNRKVIKSVTIKKK